MKRALATCALFVLSGCFKFDEKLAECRNDAGMWICPKTPPDGGSGSSVTFPYDDLQCFAKDGGWCWEHPRPAGGRFLSAFARAPNDVFFGTEHGLILELTDAGWRTAFLAPFHRITALCGRPSTFTVYAGAQLGNPGATEDRVFAVAGEVFTRVPNTASDISDLDCAPDFVWIAHDAGVWRLELGSTGIDGGFDAPSPEQVKAVASTGLGTALALTDSSTGVMLRDQNGVAIGSGLPMFTAVDLARLANGDVHAAVTDGVQIAIWTLDAGGAWSQLYSNTADPTVVFNDTTPWGANGSIAVGSSGLIVEIESNSAVEKVVPTVGDNVHLSVTALPTGEAWAAGEAGCVLSRAPGGTWNRITDCDRFVDFSIGTEVVAITSDAIFTRSSSGWSRQPNFQDLVGVWANPDGGQRALLRGNGIRYGMRELPITFADAMDFEVLDESRVVVLLRSGTVIDTNLNTGADAGVATLGGDSFITIDRKARTFWVWGGGSAWSSSRPGVWDFVDAGVPIDSVATGFGRVWLVASEVVFASLPDGGWNENRQNNSSFNYAVPLDATRALVSQNSGPAFIVDDSLGTMTQFDSFPFTPARVAVTNDDIWILGFSEGLIRRPIPPKP